MGNLVYIYTHNGMETVQFVIWFVTPKMWTKCYEIRKLAMFLRDSFGCNIELENDAGHERLKACTASCSVRYVYSVLSPLKCFDLFTC